MKVPYVQSNTPEPVRHAAWWVAFVVVALGAAIDYLNGTEWRATLAHALTSVVAILVGGEVARSRVTPS